MRAILMLVMILDEKKQGCCVTIVTEMEGGKY